MATSVSAELLDGLREQLLVGLTDAADRGFLLKARGFAPVGWCAVPASDVLAGYGALPLLEAVVVGLRFSVRTHGLSRVAVADLLGLCVREVERLERSALKGLSLVMEVS